MPNRLIYQAPNLITINAAPTPAERVVFRKNVTVVEHNFVEEIVKRSFEAAALKEAIGALLNYP